jgi:chorismate synthase
LIHSFNENLVPLTDSVDLAIVDLWAGVTELFLAENLSIKDSLAGIIEFFAEHIPRYLHDYVLARLSAYARHKLFSTLAVLVTNE